MTTSWKSLLTEAESILNNMKDHGNRAHRMAQIVRELWKNASFLDDECQSSVDQAETRLSAFSGWFGLGLHDMLQMIEHFPDVVDWKDGRLDVLRDRTCQILAKRRQATASTVTTERKFVQAEKYEELRQKNRQLHETIKGLKRQIIELTAKLRGRGQARRKRRLQKSA